MVFKTYSIPGEITMDKSGANFAAIQKINKKLEKNAQTPIKIRQCKYKNNRIEQDHRTIK